MVFGLRLADGRDVVVKARADDGRAVSCVEAQARLAERGFPCARPLTTVAGAGSLAVHAEEFRPGGEVLHGDLPDVAVRYAEVFARLMAELASASAGGGRRRSGLGTATGRACGVLGHADFEAQNIRWHGREVGAVHDWDSLAWQPEAARGGERADRLAPGPAILSWDLAQAGQCRGVRHRRPARRDQAVTGQVWTGSLVCMWSM